MSLILEIKQKLRISDIVSKYAELKPSGGVGKFVSRCPLPGHDDKDPSFHVYDDSNNFKCFGCNASGDLIDFIRLVEGKDNTSAIAHLATIAGIDRARQLTGADKQRMSHFAVMRDLCAFYRESLFGPKGKNALAYLLSRGISETTIRAFSLGFAPGYSGNEVVRIVKRHGLSEERAIETGLLKMSDEKKVYDPFFRRIIFPIFSGHGSTPAGFGGRTLDNGGVKYVNSTNSEYYTKGDCLYGYAQARKRIAETKTAVVVEGYMDVLSMHDKEFCNTSAVLGTAITKNQILLLKKAYATRVIFLMDGDKAGLEAAKKGIGAALAGGLTPFIALLPPEDDPSSILQHSEGQSAIQSLLEKAESGLDFVLRSLSDSPVEFSEWVRVLLAETEDKLMRLIWLSKIASHMGVPGDYLLRALDLCKEIP